MLASLFSGQGQTRVLARVTLTNRFPSLEFTPKEARLRLRRLSTETITGATVMQLNYIKGNYNIIT